MLPLRENALIEEVSDLLECPILNPPNGSSHVITVFSNSGPSSSSLILHPAMYDTRVVFPTPVSPIIMAMSCWCTERLATLFF
jgi:hypothetical protein